MFNVYGFGFGDDENAWEFCEAFATRSLADKYIDDCMADDIAHGGVANEYKVEEV